MTLVIRKLYFVGVKSASSFCLSQTMNFEILASWAYSSLLRCSHLKRYSCFDTPCRSWWLKPIFINMYASKLHIMTSFPAWIFSCDSGCETCTTFAILLLPDVFRMLANRDGSPEFSSRDGNLWPVVGVSLRVSGHRKGFRFKYTFSVLFQV